MASLLLRASSRAANQAPCLLRAVDTAVAGASRDVLGPWSQLACSTSYSTPTRADMEKPGQQHDDATKRKARVNRLLYRSKQRGFLEMDLLVGLWAQEHLPRASDSLLDSFEEVLQQENPDLFKWLTGQLPAPEELTQNKAFQALQASVGQQLKATVQPPARTKPGAEWVRGWDDWKQQPLHGSKAESA